jgi:hypothetical protein
MSTWRIQEAKSIFECMKIKNMLKLTSKCFEYENRLWVLQFFPFGEEGFASLYLMMVKGDSLFKSVKFSIKISEDLILEANAPKYLYTCGNPYGFSDLIYTRDLLNIFKDENVLNIIIN